MESFINGLIKIIWGPPMLLLLLATGLYLMVGLRFLPIRKFCYAFGELLRKRDVKKGEISPFSALMTALSATIGTGNIAGVAVAITIGGPGAIFWMWMTALVGMATKYAEAVLAVKFRRTTETGQRMGGPMYYIRDGLGPRWGWLAFLFALFGMFAAWGTGAAIQSNSIADIMQSTFNIPPGFTGLLLASGAAAVILGGITRIARVASALVPIMAGLYILAGLVVIIFNISAVPAAFALIFKSAFGFDAAAGGVVGGGLIAAMRQGVARGIFSNEAGQGTAPIAHAASNNNDPVNQGIVAMLGTVIDTLFVCSITALVILTTGVLGSVDPVTGEALSSAPLTAAAFGQGLPGAGQYLVTFALVLFGFTTILGWSFYGERAAEFIFGSKIRLPFRFSWIFFVFLGAALISLKGGEGELPIVQMAWNIADILTGLMAAPNLIALILLSPLVFRLTQDYFKN